MTANKLAGIVYVIICMVGIGYWLVPSTPRDHVPAETAIATGAVSAAAPVSGAPGAPPAGPSRPAATASIVTVSTPELHARIKPVLSHGTNMTMASQDFDNATEFAAVAHAANNTRVPFVLLKYRVLTQRMTLANAIRASLPRVDAEVEADLAFAQARSDIAALAR